MSTKRFQRSLIGAGQVKASRRSNPHSPVLTVARPAILLAMVAVILPWSCNRLAAQQDRQALKEYLRQHQLHDLYGALLEQELEEAANPEQARRTAAELATVYAWELNARPEKFELLESRLTELGESWPEAIPVSTLVNIAYGRYRRAREQFEAWTFDRENEVSRIQVHVLLQEMIEQANVAERQVADRLQNSQPETDAWKELETARAQFRYMAAWSSYYQAIATRDPSQQRKLLEVTQAEFAALLEIADSDLLLEFSPQWWSLNSEWTCRLLLGMAMTCQALAQDEKAGFCFNLLTESRVPRGIRESQRVWRFHSFVFPGQIEQADIQVRRWTEIPAITDDSQLWSTVATWGICWPEPRAECTNMIRTGLTNLAKANDFASIDELLKQFPETTVAGSGFFSRWMDGYAALRRWQQSNSTAPPTNNQANLERARKELMTALDDDRPIEPVYRARCRYHYGFTLFSQLHFELAAPQFRQAAIVLGEQDPALAAHAAWMECQALGRLAGRDPAWRGPLVFALEQFLQQFPDSPHRGEAAFMQLLGNSSGATRETLTTLKSIGPNDQNYIRALFETARISHQLWTQSVEPGTQQQLASETLEAAEACFESASSSLFAAQRFRTGLLAADVEMNRGSTEAAKSWLLRIESSIDQAPLESASDYYFLRMQIAANEGVAEIEFESRDWLLRNSTDPQHRRSALVSRAAELDRRLLASEQAEPMDRDRLIPVIDAFQRLVDEYESDSPTESMPATLRSATMRLAELQAAAGNHLSARDQYRKLHQQSPNERACVLGLARAETRLHNHEAASPLWRTLMASAATGSGLWLESRYNLALGLVENNPADATALVQQTKLLMPELPELWQDRFDQLMLRLNEDNESIN